MIFIILNNCSVNGRTIIVKRSVSLNETNKLTESFADSLVDKISNEDPVRNAVNITLRFQLIVAGLRLSEIQ